MALSNKTKRLRAEDLYINSEFNQTEICELVEVSDKTLREWKTKYGWDEIKKNNSVTTPKIISTLNQKLYELSEENAIANADKIVKIAAAIEKLRGKQLFLSNYIEVFKDFTDYLFSKEPEAAKAFNVHMKDFINHKIHGKD